MGFLRRTQLAPDPAGSYLTLTKSLMIEETDSFSNKRVYSQGLLLAGGQMTYHRSRALGALEP